MEAHRHFRGKSTRAGERRRVVAGGVTEVAAPDGLVSNKKRIASGTYAPCSTMHVVVGVTVLFVVYLVLKL